MAKILIIEDNITNMKLASFLLERYGHTVLQAMEAETGQQLAQKEKPDLILMDIQLPDRDGLTLTRMLKSDPATTSIKIIALTAFVMKGDEEKIRAAGCDGYIAKPFHHQEFMAVIEAALT